MENRNFEKQLKSFRVSLFLAIFLGISAIIIFWILRINFFIAIISAFLPTFLILFLFGQQFQKKFKFPKIQFLKPELTKTRLLFLIFLFIIGLGFIFISPYLAAIFLLIVVLLAGHKFKLLLKLKK
jgi:amino acid permease